jgi:4-hydroxyphenylacetate 3-monooxygenase
LWQARGSGALDGMIALAEQCLADYDENGWRNPAWLNANDAAHQEITGTAAE